MFLFAPGTLGHSLCELFVLLPGCAVADDELSTPKPGFLRRSFSEWRRTSISSLPESASDLVEPSDGSATIRKMRDMIRRR